MTVSSPDTPSSETPSSETPSPETLSPETPSPETTEELAAEIEATRAALGDTVAALAAKADVKARLVESASHATERIADTGSEIVSGLSNTAGNVAGLLERAAAHIRKHPVQWLLGAAATLIVLIATRSRRR